MLSRRVAAVVTIVIVVAFVIVAVAPAFAAPASLATHSRLLGSTPRDGSTVATATEVVLEFNEEVDATFVQVTVTGPGGGQAEGKPTVDGRSVTQALSPELPAGAHVVTYRVVSSDGHPIAGRVTFTTTVAPSASASPTATPSASATASATPSASVTASAAPSPTTGPATEPVSDDEASRWPWLLAGLAAVLSVVALARARRTTGGPPADAEADAAAGGRPDGADDDPSRTSRDEGRGPFA